MQARDLGIGIFLDSLDFHLEFNKRNPLLVSETSVTCFNGFISVQAPYCQVPVGIIDEQVVTSGHRETAEHQCQHREYPGRPLMRKPQLRRRHHKVRYFVFRALPKSFPVELKRSNTDAHHMAMNDWVKFELPFLSRDLVLRFGADFYAAWLTFMNEPISGVSPYGQAIGMSVQDTTDSKLTVKVPYAAHLVGDPDTGVIHGGVITAALDNASGSAVRVSKDWHEGLSMATLDIRIDYMKPATPQVDLLVTAECYKRTKTIAFVRAVAYHESEDDPVATSVATFMMGTPNQRRS